MSEKKMLLLICTMIVILIAFVSFFLYLFAQSGLFDGHDSEQEAFVFHYVRGNFITYESPDFFAPVIGEHTGHIVRVLEQIGNNWMKISSNQAYGWLFLGATSHIIDRPLGAFINKDDSSYTYLIRPGEISVLLEEEGWLLTRYNNLPVWVQLDFWPSFELIREFLSGLNLSVYYKNIKSGFTFGFRDNIIYTSASLNKTPHALYVFYLAENGLTDLSQEHIFTPARLRDGTGSIRHNYDYGHIFTELELLVYSIRDSDNTAFRWLESLYSIFSPSYREFYQSIGGNMDLVGQFSNHLMTAAEAGHIMMAIYNYIESDGIYASYFKYALLNSDVPIIVSDHPVAQKYGRWEGFLHDKAIVYAPSPYILTILSRLDTGSNSEEAFRIFAEISMFIQAFNDRYFN